MLLTNMIDNNRMLMLTQGQGYKVKSQGQNNMQFSKKDVFTIFNEQMI